MPSWLIFLIVLSVLVLIHELGHFLAAKLFGIRVEEFALGLPYTRALWQTKIGETQYSLYPLLFGGFVRLHGEESQELVDASRSFWSRGRKQRMLVVAAGVIMNVLLAFVLFVGFYTALGVPVKTTNKVTVLSVEADSPAAVSGLKFEDRIVAVEGKTVADSAELSKLMKSWAGTPVNLTVESGTGVYLLDGILDAKPQVRTVSITGRLNPPEGQGPLGIGLGDYPYIQTEKNLGKVVPTATNSMITWISRILDGLRQVGASVGHGKVPEGLSGPVGIYQLTDAMSKGGFWPIIQLMAVLSVNLGVLNVLPIPALDGGRMFFIWLEWARRKRLSAELEQKINAWGMTVLLILIGLITLQDVIKTSVVQSILTKYFHY